MTITIKTQLLKTLFKSPIGDILKAQFSTWDVRQLENDTSDNYNYIKLPTIKQADLVNLRDHLSTVKEVNKQSVNTIDAWLETMNNPANGKVSNVQNMEKIFDALYKKLPNKWLVQEQRDGSMQPVLVTGFKYNPPSRGSSASFDIKMSYGMFGGKKERWSDDKTNTGSYTDNDSVYFSYFDFRDENGEVEEELSWDFEEDDDEEVKPEKKKPGKSFLMSELLQKKGLYIPTKDTLIEYLAQQKRVITLLKQVGTLHTCNSTAFLLDGYGWDVSSTRPQEDGRLNKLVVDTEVQPTAMARSTQDKNGKEQPLPYMPYLTMYDISKHRGLRVNVDKLTPYAFNDKIEDELIIPETNKRLLTSLIEGDIMTADVVQGKSGGVIVLCSGIPGTGKTLTAEVYSEVMHKPLYQIQSAQLGLSIDDIEKNLHEVMRRAQRWNAVLLIDECDTYVRQRGEDMLQNAIVGTFLRLLEYFNGVMFFTTNRGDIIDAAIMSRVTVHLHYGVPDLRTQVAITEVLGKHYGVEVDLKLAGMVFSHYTNMTGREIRNLMKLLKKFYAKEKSVVFDMATIEPLAAFIPFISQQK